MIKTNGRKSPELTFISIMDLIRLKWKQYEAMKCGMSYVYQSHTLFEHM